MSPFQKGFCILVATSCLGTGCFWKKKQPESVVLGKTTKTNEVVIMPALSAVGRVAFVNSASRFAVLDFPAGGFPGLKQKLNVYRNNLKIGEMIVTGPKTAENIIADILTGEIRAGDEARED